MNEVNQIEVVAADQADAAMVFEILETVDRDQANTDQKAKESKAEQENSA